MPPCSPCVFLRIIFERKGEHGVYGMERITGITELIKDDHQIPFLYSSVPICVICERKVAHRKHGCTQIKAVVLGFFFFIYQQITGVDLWGYSTFIFETTSLLFFGTAWLVKGSEFWSRNAFLRPILKGLR